MNLVCLAAILLVATVSGTNYTPDWKSIDSRPLPIWYDEAKFGIFLHWGVFSVPSFVNEWFWENWITRNDQRHVKFMKKNYKPGFTYPEFAEEFTAELWDPDWWANLFSDAGAGYVVLTTKHHEGFTLWPSKYSWNWNAGDVGPKRDLVGDLAKAIRKHPNLKFGTYHSLLEWFHPLYMEDKASNFTTQKFPPKVWHELKDLVETYQPDVLWADGEWEADDSYWGTREFIAWLYNDSPVKDNVVINDRWGKNVRCYHGGFINCQDLYHPGALQPRKWENAMTIDRGSFGYRREATLNALYSTEQLIHLLVDTVAYGGNLLVNIGPGKDGRIAPSFEERLRGMGSWLKTNGEAIYKTQPRLEAQNDTGSHGVFYTTRESYLYTIITKWPRNNQLKLNCIHPESSDSLDLIGYGPVSWTNEPMNKIVIHLPFRDEINSKYAWVLRMPIPAPQYDFCA